MIVTKRFSRSILAMIALCCLALLAACGGSTEAAKPTPIPLLNSTFTSDDGVYTLDFPGNWTKTPVNTIPIVNGVRFLSPDTMDLFSVFPVNQGFTDVDFKGFFPSFLQSAGVTGAKLTSETPTTEKQGDNEWKSYQATGILNSIQYGAADLFMNHNGNAFIIVVMAPYDDMLTVGKTYFDPMSASFKFLK
jgi:hypothetical protein